MDDKLAKTIGNAARAARMALKLTQEDAADRIGVSIEFYSRIERGKTLPSVPTLFAIANKLAVEADQLLGLVDEKMAPSRAKTNVSDTSADAATRKLLRRIRDANPSTIRLLNLVLLEIVNGAPRKRGRTGGRS